MPEFPPTDECCGVRGAQEETGPFAAERSAEPDARQGHARRLKMRRRCLACAFTRSRRSHQQKRRRDTEVGAAAKP
jgi:hypothetical protein